MPIYAYKCSTCGHALEVLQKVSDPRRTDCPACGQPTLEKQLTAAGFQLKGSGWYVTDFRSNNQTAAAKKDEAPSAEAGSEAAKSTDQPAGKPDAKTETKTEAKSETKTESATPAPAVKSDAPAPATSPKAV